MEQIIRGLAAYLPPDVTQILLNPPSLSSPSSFLPLFRLAFPLAKYLVVIIAFWIVWASLSGVFGYAARIIRFGLKVGPIIGIISWLMGNSGQGGMGDVFNVARQWAGMGGQGAGNNAGGPGLANLAGMFGGGDNGAKTRQSTRGRNSARNAPAANGGPDIMSSIFNTAQNWMGQGAGGGGGGLQNVVMDYVKQAMNAAAEPQVETAEEKRRKRRAGL